MADRVMLFEVGPRDGLQNEATPIPTSDKVHLVDGLSRCGLRKIEVTSFVNPKLVPQMADAAEVMTQIRRAPNVTYAALTPNLRGFNAAWDANADEVAVFASASEGFSQANINCSISESLDRFRPILAAAHAHKIPVRGYVSCVIDCPYDGPTDPNQVAQVSTALAQMGCYEISLGDTIGAGTTDRVDALLEVVLKSLPANRLAGHFHDTQNRALANIEVCLSKGLRVFDTSIGGLGGCPYAPGAPGNVATEVVADWLHRAGYDTGLDAQALTDMASFAKTLRPRT